MAIGVKTLEAKDVQSNQLNLCGELTNAGGYDYILAYFMYSRNENLDNSYKSDDCALLSSPTSYELTQDNIDDNVYYYYKATAENFESTETQMEHLKNLKILNTNSSDIFNNENIVSSLLNNAKTFASLFNSENNMYNIWKSDNLDMIFDVSKEVSGGVRETSFGEESIYIHTDDTNQTLTFNEKIDFSKITSLKIDLDSNLESRSNTKLYIDDDDDVLSINDTFERKTIEVDVSDINTTSSLEIVIDGPYHDINKTEIFGIWGE